MAFISKHTATNIKRLLAVTIKLNAAGFLTYSNFPKQHSVTAGQCLITSTINKSVQYSFIVIFFFKSCAVQMFGLGFELLVLGGAFLFQSDWND